MTNETSLLVYKIKINFSEKYTTFAGVRLNGSQLNETPDSKKIFLIALGPRLFSPRPIQASLSEIEKKKKKKKNIR
jgi:hypothetical protein